MSDALALAQTIAAGRTNARAAMRASLDAIAVRPDLGAVARLLPELEAEALADSAVIGAPFSGVPVLAKDLGSAARGLAPAAGSPALRKRVADPAADSPFFARLRAGGVVPFGLSTVPEFGFALSSEPPGHPPARNPFDLSRTPGGSSGGAAAAVAGGLVALAHATDAAGSIRVPAACCGLWGLKPSRGTMPQSDDFANDLMGLAVDGVLARSLGDVATAFDLTAGTTKGPCPDPAPHPLSERPVIGVVLPAGCNRGIEAATQATADLFAQAGCMVAPIDLLDGLATDCHALAWRILCVGQAGWLAATGIALDEVSPLIAAAARRGATITGPDAMDMARQIAILSRRAWQVFEAVDAVLMPVLSGPPPAIGHFDFTSGDLDAHLAATRAFAPGIEIANICGLPALAIPAGMQDSLPVGVQLIGPMGGDRALFALAARIADDLPPIPYPAPIAGMPT